VKEWTLWSAPWVLFALVCGLAFILLHDAFTGDFLGFLPEPLRAMIERAFDIPPPNRLLSGSVESHVPFDTLSRAGRRYVWMACAPDKIDEVMGEPAVATPIRAYVGLESAATEQERVDLTMRELERTAAFDRAWLMIASPTDMFKTTFSSRGT